MADARFDKLVIGRENDVHVSLLPNGIRLHDEHGDTRGELLMDDEKPTLFMYDRNGQARLAVLIEYDGTPLIQLHDANGKKRGSISTKV